MDETQARRDSPIEQPASPPTDDAADLARVAQLVGRAGLPLTTEEIGQLVAQYRYDRRGFDRLRTMLAAEDETAHSFQAARVMRPAGERSETSSADDGDAGAGR